MTASRRITRSTDEIPDTVATVSRSLVWGWLIGIGFAWLILLWSVFTGSWSLADRQSQLWLVIGAVIVGGLTFLPFEMTHDVRGLTMRGVLGLVVLIQVLVYVPAPTRSILELSDLPVYLLVIFGGYWLLSSLFMPVLYLIGLRIFVQRSRRYDVRRSYRQGAELALLFVGVFVLFALKALTPILAMLWVAMIIIAEVIFLSFIEPPATR